MQWDWGSSSNVKGAIACQAFELSPIQDQTGRMV